MLAGKNFRAAIGGWRKKSEVVRTESRVRRLGDVERTRITLARRRRLAELEERNREVRDVEVVRER